REGPVGSLLVSELTPQLPPYKMLTRATPPRRMKQARHRAGRGAPIIMKHSDRSDTATEDLLMRRTARPDCIQVNEECRLVPGFTTKKYEEQMKRSDTRGRASGVSRGLPLGELVEVVQSVIDAGSGNLDFGYDEGRIRLSIHGTSCTLRCRA